MAKKNQSPDIVVLTGGGSGGHITPLQAIAAEIKRRNPQIRVVYIGHKGDTLSDIPTKDPNFDDTYLIRAGKLRRYHGEGIKQLFDICTLFLNVRDVFYLLIGIYQSRRILRRLRPAVVFVKGGFVGVPVGLAAARLSIPYITHDSDIIPGLANRLIAKNAAVHAVAMPADAYDYPPDKTISTGIPLRSEFKPVTTKDQIQYKVDLGLNKSSQLLFVIGGGLGAQRINNAFAKSVPELLSTNEDLRIFHVVGRKNDLDVEGYYKKLPSKEQGRVQALHYIDDVYRYSGAADLIITRAGATNLAEFSLQNKACIVIPSPFLSGGHQLKNAKYLQDQEAIVSIDETEMSRDQSLLAVTINDLLADENRRKLLANNFSKFAKPDATPLIVEIIFKQIIRK